MIAYKTVMNKIFKFMEFTMKFLFFNIMLLFFSFYSENKQGLYCLYNYVFSSVNNPSGRRNA